MFSSSNLESSGPEYQRALGVHMLVQSMHFIDDDTGAKEVARELSPRSDGWKKVEYRTESRSPYCRPGSFHRITCILTSCSSSHTVSLTLKRVLTTETTGSRRSERLLPFVFSHSSFLR